MKKRILWLVDHLLEDVIGHHLGYNLALAGGIREAGWNPVLVTHRDFDPGLASKNEVRRVFRTDWRSAPPQWMTRDMRLLGLLERVTAARFGADLRRLAPYVSSGDAIFAQMIAPRHFLAWLRWAEARDSPPRLALHLGYQPARFGHPAIREALGKLPPKVRESLRFVTDSELLTGPFEAALGVQVAYLPHVVDRVFPAAPLRREDAPLRFLALGNARREKGFAEIAGAAGLLRREREEGKLHLTIQCHQPDAESAKALAGVKDEPGLRWIRRSLSDDEYVSEIVQADAILLPYHLDHYELRTSGVFCEARVAGKPVVGSVGSWLGGRITRDGGGWLVPERDAEALAGCLRAVPRDFARVASHAAVQASATAGEHCPRVFVRQLLALWRGGRESE